MKSPIVYPQMASVKRAAELFNVSAGYIRTLCRTGKVRYTAISSRKWLVNLDSLARFFEQGEPAPEQPQTVNGIRPIAVNH